MEVAVIRWMVRASWLMVWLVIAQAGLAQEFSADVIQNKLNSKERVNKVYAVKDKVRFEVTTANTSMGPSAVIFDEARHSHILLMTERHMYMEVPTPTVKYIATNFWRVQDVDDACPAWKKIIEDVDTAKNWGSCTNVGHDLLNGRATVKYEGVSKKGEKMHIWVDVKLHVVVKTNEGDPGASGDFELRNIREGPQPASLFEIPAGYTKFDMGMMKQPH